MSTSKFEIKFYVASEAPAPAVLIPVFHAWIRERALREVMIDVADYAHVPRGPGVVLVCHDAHIHFEDEDGRHGLSYRRKRGGASDSVAQELREALAAALRAAALLADAPELAGLRFDTREFVVRASDRLRVPNDADSYGALVPVLTASLEAVFGAGLELEREATDPRQKFAVRIRTPKAVPLNELLSRLEATA